MIKNIKPKIALIAGGYSKESEISIRSAAVVGKMIDKEKFDIYCVSITQNEWSCIINDTKCYIDKNDFSITIENSKINFDLAFIMIHGTPGEDGKLQGYFDMLNIPYTSCSSVVSSITFNKYYCNKFMHAIGANIAQSIVLRKNQKFDLNSIAHEINFPCFVKPNSGGSSIGTSKVEKIEDLKTAIENAFVEDNEVLVEKYLKGREITCGVIKVNNKIIAFPLTEIISKNSFFDFESKYNESLADEITPANLSKILTERIQQMSINLYEKLNCSLVVRFDYIVDNENIWFLEVNTIPGMSAQSIVPQQAAAYGWTYTQLTTNIIEEALRNKTENE